MELGADARDPVRNRAGLISVDKPNCRQRSSMVRKKQKNLKRVRLQRRKRLNNINRRMRKLKEEMEVVAKEQKSVKKGQEEIREKLKTVGAECDQLRKETEIILQQRAATLVRLNPIIEILKAKKDSNLSKVTSLILSLRELMTKQNKPQ